MGKRKSRLMMKKLLVLLLAVSVVISSSVVSFADDAAVDTEIFPKVEPESEFVPDESLTEQIQDTGRDPFDYVSGKQVKEALSKEFPAALDLRNFDTDGDGVGDTSFVTPIKCQAPFGTCWGFAAVAAAETSILGAGLAEGYAARADEPAGLKELNLSEKHLAYFVTQPLDDPFSPQNGEGTYLNDGRTVVNGLNNGGYPFLATNTFIAGIGPILEEEDVSLQYKGGQRQKDGSIDYSKATINTERIDGKWVPVAYSEEDDWSLREDLRFRQSFILANSYMLPTPAGRIEDNSEEYEYNPAGTQAIKEQLMNRRAVEIGYYSTKFYIDDNHNRVPTMNEATWAHFTDMPGRSNHAVTIIGWDDRYPKENFAQTPEGDGAWLVKNSWGSGEESFPNMDRGNWGLLQGQDDYDSSDGETRHYAAKSDVNTGYFWLSYYDRTIENPEALEFDISSFEDEDHFFCDQHDLMPTLTMHSAATESEMKMANIFCAKQGQQLNQVSCQTSVPGTRVEYEIYLLGNNFSGPEDGVLVANGYQNYEFGGLHRMDFEPVVMAKGQYYSIIVTEHTPEGGYAVSLPEGMSREQAGRWDTTWQKGIINEKESYLYIDGEWRDYSDESLRRGLFGESFSSAIDNLPIKGFGIRTGSDMQVKIAAVSDNKHLCSYPPVAEPVRYSVTLKGSSGIPEDGGDVYWSRDERSKEFFDIETDENTDEVIVTPKKTGKGYLMGYVAGVGSAVVPINVSDLEIYNMDLENDDYVYTGEPIEPKVQYLYMIYEGITLVEGQDYTLSYQDNVKCGQAWATFMPAREDIDVSPKEDFIIRPEESEITKVTPGINKLTVSFVSQKDSGVSGYELTYTPTEGGETKTITLSDEKESAVITGLKEGTSYNVSLKAYVTIDEERYYGKAGKSVTSGAVKGKQANPLTIKPKTATVKYSKLKKKAQKLAVTKVIKFTKKGQGKMSYTLSAAKKGKKSFKKYFKINKTTGKVTIRKNRKMKKGTYKVKVKVKAAGNANYKASAVKTVTFKIKIK